ncbi:MAG: hypothetical protein EAZ40_11200 [Rhodobacterales bacterium]|nr:MAG: hypothetical protein EAZ40_11200 [Rhodobacterales bacterium]
METFVQTFSDLIRDRLSELQLNAFSAENAAGLPPDAIRNVLRSEKNAGPTLARTKEICDALGLEIRIAPKNEMAQMDATEMARADVSNGPPSGFLTIPWAESGPGAGSAPVCFSRGWLEDHGLKPDFLQATLPEVVEIEGMTSVDTLAVLDNRIGLRKGHGLWCYRAKGRVHVSHVTFSEGVTVLHGARPEDDPQIIHGFPDATIGILGKVVWLGQSIPFRGSVK